MKLKYTKYHLCEELLFERSLSYKLQDEWSPPTAREREGGGEGRGDENDEPPILWKIKVTSSFFEPKYVDLNITSALIRQGLSSSQEFLRFAFA